MRSTNFTIVQGMPFEFRTQLKRRDEDDELVSMQLNGCTVRLQARESLRSDKIVLDLSSDGNGITIDEEAGIITFKMSSEETSALKWGNNRTGLRAMYQSEVYPEDGEPIRILQGTLTLDPEVIR